MAPIRPHRPPIAHPQPDRNRVPEQRCAGASEWGVRVRVRDVLGEEVGEDAGEDAGGEAPEDLGWGVVGEVMSGVVVGVSR